MTKRFTSLRAQAACVALLVAANLAGTVTAGAQTPVRFLGTITAISGNTITVKVDTNGIHQVNVPATAEIKRISPGQKDLSAAETIPFGKLESGDRVRVKLDPNAPAGAETAMQIIAVKQTDLAEKQRKDREDWQLRGVGGLVKSVDVATGDIVLSSGSGATAKAITVHTTKTTVLKRYAPASVRFDDAQVASIDAIHAGDQLRARGTKNADSTEITAEDVVSGSFRNIAGTIVSLDTASSTLIVKDLATKKPVTIHISADAQMRRLPEMMAQFLAARLKGTTGAAAAGGNGSASVPRGNGQGGVQWAGRNGGQGGGFSDPQQMLNHAPAIQLSDLKKGDAVMVVSTEGTAEVSAITLLAGVEPLLEAPAASQDLLANWSMSSGSSMADTAQ
jgi:hypothetical protein